MAVQAQYPSSVLLLNRGGEQEVKQSIEFTPATPGIVDQPSADFFFPPSNGGGGIPRRRGREVAAAPMAQSQQPYISLSPSMPSPAGLTSHATLQAAQPPPLVSTGLRLAFENQTQVQAQSQSHSSPLLSSFLSDDLSALLAHHRHDLDRFIQAQWEELRRALGERRQRHERALLGAAAEAGARRLREKEAELERAARRGAELQDRLARLRAESMAWQAKALADQATAAALHQQLQQAATAAGSAPQQSRADECGESPAEDAESAHIDPHRAEPVRTSTCARALCRACGVQHVSVVLLPCRHLCLCANCDAACGPASAACPVCRCARTGSVPVFLS